MTVNRSHKAGLRSTGLVDECSGADALPVQAINSGASSESLAYAKPRVPCLVSERS